MILIPKFEQAKSKNTVLEINLDGCFGYPSSFLDEAFGGLAKKYGSENVLKVIRFICNDQPTLKNVISEYILGTKN